MDLEQFVRHHFELSLPAAILFFVLVISFFVIGSRLVPHNTPKCFRLVNVCVEESLSQ